MLDDVQLGEYMQSEEGFKNYELAMKTESEERSRQVTSKEVREMQKVIMRDWVTLTGKKGPGYYVEAKTTEPICEAVEAEWSKAAWSEALQAVKNTGKIKGDRPFARTSPGEGFLDLNEDIVSALSITAQLRWGAIELGGASGDLHHFDMGLLKPDIMSKIRKAKKDFKKSFGKKK